MILAATALAVGSTRSTVPSPKSGDPQGAVAEADATRLAADGDRRGHEEPVDASIREIVPSPWFDVHTEPAPAAMFTGPLPDGDRRDGIRRWGRRGSFPVERHARRRPDATGGIRRSYLEHVNPWRDANAIRRRTAAESTAIEDAVEAEAARWDSALVGAQTERREGGGDDAGPADDGGRGPRGRAGSGRACGHEGDHRGHERERDTPGSSSRDCSPSVHFLTL